MKVKKNIAISESGFVFDPTSGESFSLNPIGAEIIELLKQEKSFDKIREIMLNKYEVDDNSFKKYYYDFINMLKQFKLIDEKD
ncbi:MAG: PqqD family protein [Bacteroidales bacterium]|nr:PqqD family protein [Bacteroidales bacterium]